MNMHGKFVFVFAVFALVMLVPGVLADTEHITGCRDTSNPLNVSNRIYILDNDIGPPITGDCMNITADHVILDCDNHAIYDPSANFSGVLTNQYNITIRNCNISMGTGSGGIGIELGDVVNAVDNSYIYNCTLNNQRIGLLLPESIFGSPSNNIKVEKVTANNNTMDGISIYTGVITTGENGTNVSMINITANNNSRYGVNLVSSSNNTLTNIIANSNLQYGIYIALISNSTLTGITANSNPQYGVRLFTSSNNNLTGITTSDSQFGTYLSSSSNNVLTDITSSNSDVGVYFASSSNNVLTDMIINSSNVYGIYFTFSSNNILTDNTLNSNNLTEILLTSSPGNTFTNNNIWNCSYTCIYIIESDYNVFDGNRINQSSNYGIIIYSAGSGGSDNTDHNLFKNTNMVNINNISVILNDDGSNSENMNNTFLNFTYNNEIVDSRSQLIRKWYYQAYVEDSAGSPLSNANVSLWDVIGNLVNYSLTNPAGLTPVYNIIQYINDSGTTTYWTPYTANASRSGHENTTIFTFSDNIVVTHTLNFTTGGGGGAPGFEPGMLLMLFAALIAGLFLPSAYTRLRKTA